MSDLIGINYMLSKWEYDELKRVSFLIPAVEMFFLSHIDAYEKFEDIAFRELYVELHVDGIKCQTYNKLDDLLKSLLFVNIVFEDNIKIFMRGTKL